VLSSAATLLDSLFEQPVSSGWISTIDPLNNSLRQDWLPVPTLSTVRGAEQNGAQSLAALLSDVSKS
jgi:hypothetical protein